MSSLCVPRPSNEDWYKFTFTSDSPEPEAERALFGEVIYTELAKSRNSRLLRDVAQCYVCPRLLEQIEQGVNAERPVYDVMIEFPYSDRHTHMERLCRALGIPFRTKLSAPMGMFMHTAVLYQDLVKIAYHATRFNVMSIWDLSKETIKDTRSKPKTMWELHPWIPSFFSRWSKGRRLLDLGGVDGSLGKELLDLGAEKCTSIELETPLPEFRSVHPNLIFAEKSFKDFKLPAGESLKEYVSIAAWPVDDAAFDECVPLLDDCAFVLYAGNNCSSVCGGMRFWEAVVKREILAMESRQKARVIVYGRGERAANARLAWDEVFGVGLHIVDKNLLSADCRGVAPISYKVALGRVPDIHRALSGFACNADREWAYKIRPLSLKNR